ncbi:MAG: transcriptional regulator [Defluviitaleaceae bacterium]|nr:transcriptional regulator [Defluviitaleaceae bacterium]
MSIIKQTNRTMDFHCYNPEKPDLITLIGEVKGIDSLEDEKINEINDKLLVKNFDEFMDKFAPVVYSFFNATDQSVSYALKKPEGVDPATITEIPLTLDNDFLKMIMTMLDARGGAGQRNADFNFENVTNMISPEKVMDDIRQTRKEIHYLYDQHEALEDGDPKKLDIADKLNDKFESASKNYNNIMTMLPLAIEDIKTRLLLGASGGEGKAAEVVAGVLTIGDEGELKIIEAPKAESTDLVLIDDTQNVALAEHFAEDYEEVSDAPTAYVKDLVVRTFAPLPATTQSGINHAQEVANYNGYLTFYKQAKDDFVKTVKPLVEKIAGVKLFFDQYRTQNKVAPPKLLVVNTPLEMLTKAGNLPRLEKYLNTVNNKNDFENTVWFGIVSGVALDGEDKVQNRRQRFKGNDKAQKNVENTMFTLGSLLNVLKDYKVQLFFNFETSEETTFDGLATKGAELYIEKCAPLAKRTLSAYAIPCYPNFTIVPKNKSGVLLDRKMVHTEEGVALSQEKEDYMRLWLEGIYVGAAYVAAGITASWQCPGFLKSHFRDITMDTPGVRFDVEAKDHGLRVLTSMAKEISGFTSSVKNEINRLNFGFCFASENATYNGNTVGNVSVYKARTLAEGNNGYEEIYKTLVSTYIERVLRYQSNDFKMDNIMHFFSNNPNSTRSKWLNSTDSVNAIIQEGDDLGYTIDDKQTVCAVDLVFNGNVKNLEVEINKTVSQAG